MATRSQPKERCQKWLQRDVDRDGSGQLLVPQCDIKASAGEDRAFRTRVASAELRNEPLRGFRNQLSVYPPPRAPRASEVSQIVTVQFDASANAQGKHREKGHENLHERFCSWKTWVRATLFASELNIPCQHKPFGMGQRVLQLPLSPDCAEGLSDIPMQIGGLEAVIETFAHGRFQQ
jgi:hypothetical protein